MYSGYCCVIGLRKICLKVTPKPFKVSIGCGLMPAPGAGKAGTSALW